MGYDEACKAAATQQGLDPITERLTAERIDVNVEQTGGFCMVAYADAGNDIRMGFTYDGGYLMCLYTSGYEWIEDQALTVRHLDEVIAVYRAVSAATDRDAAIAAFYLADNEIVDTD